MRCQIAFICYPTNLALPERVGWCERLFIGFYGREWFGGVLSQLATVPLKQEVPCSIAARHRLYWLQCDLFCSRAIWAFALCAAELEAVGQVSRDVQAVQIRAGQRAAGESGGKAVSKLKLRAEIEVGAAAPITL